MRPLVFFLGGSARATLPECTSIMSDERLAEEAEEEEEEEEEAAAAVEAWGRLMPLLLATGC